MDLTPKQQEAVQLLALPIAPEIQEVAAKLGLNRKTLTRWQKLPDFIAALEIEKAAQHDLQ